MSTNWTAEDALKAEEERSARFRSGTLAVSASQQIRTQTTHRVAIHDKILGYYFTDLRSLTKNFDQSPELFSAGIANILRRSLPAAAIQRIESFARGESEPFLVLRNVLSVPAGFPKTEYRYRKIAGDWDQPVISKRQRQMRVIDSTLGGLLCLLHSVPTHRFASIHRCSYDLTTRWDYQQTFDSPQPDLPLRFHQRTVERPLPRSTADPATTALYAAFGAIRNPRRIPILLLPVDTVIATLRALSKSASEFDETIRMLREPIYTKEYPRLSRHVYQIDAVRAGEPILGTFRGKDVMSFDSSLVWVSRSDEQRGMEAINKLRLAIEHASWDRAYEIRLARHDVLLVDNLRALVARAEETPSPIDLLSLPQLRDQMRRWLREMHGFAHRPHDLASTVTKRGYEYATTEPASLE